MVPFSGAAQRRRGDCRGVKPGSRNASQSSVAAKPRSANHLDYFNTGVSLTCGPTHAAPGPHSRPYEQAECGHGHEDQEGDLVENTAPLPGDHISDRVAADEPQYQRGV